MEYEKNGNYNPRDVYNNNQDVRQVLTQLVNGILFTRESGTVPCPL